MSIQTDIETALKTLLQADGALATVTTFETNLRECLFAEEKLADGFRAGELPAINITAQLKKKSSEPITCGEVQHLVPVTIVIVCGAQRAAEARTQAEWLMAEVERMLNGQRASGSVFSPNGWITGPIDTDLLRVDSKPLRYAIATIDCTVSKIVSI